MACLFEVDGSREFTIREIHTRCSPISSLADETAEGGRDLLGRKCSGYRAVHKIEYEIARGLISIDLSDQTTKVGIGNTCRLACVKLKRGRILYMNVGYCHICTCIPSQGSHPDSTGAGECIGSVKIKIPYICLNVLYESDDSGCSGNGTLDSPVVAFKREYQILKNKSIGLNITGSVFTEFKIGIQGERTIDKPLF